MTKNSLSQRYGLTIPLLSPIHDQKSKIEQLSGMGFTDVWTAEALGFDGLSPLVLASQWAPELRLGTAILPVYTRGPALLAQSIAALENISPGNVAIGIGSSSNIIVENMNAVEFKEPYKRVRDTLRFLKAALTSEKVTEAYDTFEVKGFRLGGPKIGQVPILVAALREGMLRLAGREANGAILNWLTRADAKEISAIVNEASQAAGNSHTPEIAARLFVCPNPNRDEVMPSAKRSMAGYLNVPVYKAFHQWRGRTDALLEHWELWDAGKRAESLDAIPDDLVDELFIHGTPEECLKRFEEFRAAGISTPIMAVIPFGGIDEWEAIQSLAPNGG